MCILSVHRPAIIGSLPFFKCLSYSSEELTPCQTKMVGRTSDRRVLMGVMPKRGKGGQYIIKNRGVPLHQLQSSKGVPKML